MPVREEEEEEEEEEKRKRHNQTPGQIRRAGPWEKMSTIHSLGATAFSRRSSTSTAGDHCKQPAFNCRVSSDSDQQQLSS